VRVVNNSRLCDGMERSIFCVAHYISLRYNRLFRIPLVGLTVTLLGSAFQMMAAATGKARLPIVDSLKDGTGIGSW